MADLIDRAALLADIDGTFVASGKSASAYAEIRGAKKIIARIKAAPTVDAVEVVRCSDCIGRSTWYNDAEYGCAVCGMSGMYPKSEDGFCSYGIQKDGDGND